MMKKNQENMKASFKLEKQQREKGEEGEEESTPLLGGIGSDGGAASGGSDLEMGMAPMKSMKSMKSIEEGDEENRDSDVNRISNLSLPNGNGANSGDEKGIEMKKMMKGIEKSDSPTKTERPKLSRGMSLTTSKKDLRKAKADKQAMDRENAKIRRRKNAQAKKDELANLVGNMKELVGISGDPPNSTWLTLERKDYGTGETIDAGKVAISISVIPKALADSNPAGE